MARAVIAWSLACGLTSCAPDVYVPPTVGVRISPLYDLRTDVSPRGALQSVPITITPEYSGTLAELTEYELFAWEGNFRLVRWPSLEPARGEWVLVESDPVGSMSMVFEPDPDLERGWYAVQVQFEEINAQLGQHAPWLRGLTGYRPPVIDGWTTIRFHVGQLPIVFVSGGLSSDFARVADLLLLLQASEQITFRDDFMDRLVVTADDAPLRCHPFPDVTERVFALTELRLTCEAVARDAIVTMRVDETLRVTGERALYDAAGHSPPTWTFVASEPPQGDGGPGDALFEAP